MPVKAIRPQAQFLRMPNKFRAFIAGFGSGKTWVGCMEMCKHFIEHPGVNQGYFAPTYPQIRDIFYPTVEEVAAEFDLDIKINQGNKEVHFYDGVDYLGTTICRSMDNPGTIIGFKIGHALLDEVDTLPIDKAELAWRKIIARMRYNVPDLKNGIDIASTPEGFRFCHKTFVQNIQEKPELAANYGIIHASTYQNRKNLPPDYISSLEEAYPAEMISAYLNGQFVNLTAGTVYRNYDRIRCGSNETIQPGEPLFIGQDFNVQHMSSKVYIQRPTGFIMAAELDDVFDTPDVIKIMKERWADHGHRIIIYPDASGKSRKTVDASRSDIALLSQAGFAVRVHPSNPSVKDRVLAANKAFEAGKVKVNAKECPTAARCLEQQSYDKNGEPDKSSGFDHSNDAATYPLAYEFPIVKPIAKMRLVGL